MMLSAGKGLQGRCGVKLHKLTTQSKAVLQFPGGTARRKLNALQSEAVVCTDSMKFQDFADREIRLFEE